MTNLPDPQQPWLNWPEHWRHAAGNSDPTDTEPFEWANELAIELLSTVGGQPDDEHVQMAQTYLTLAFMHNNEVGDLVKQLLSDSDQLRTLQRKPACSHPKYGDTERCGEMSCPNYVGKRRASTEVTLCPKCRTALASPDEEHPCLEDDEAPRNTSRTWGPWGPEGRQGL